MHFHTNREIILDSNIFYILSSFVLNNRSNNFLIRISFDQRLTSIPSFNYVRFFHQNSLHFTNHSIFPWKIIGKCFGYFSSFFSLYGQCFCRSLNLLSDCHTRKYKLYFCFITSNRTLSYFFEYFVSCSIIIVTSPYICSFEWKFNSLFYIIKIGLSL